MTTTTHKAAHDGACWTLILDDGTVLRAGRTMTAEQVKIFNAAVTEAIFERDARALRVSSVGAAGHDFRTPFMCAVALGETPDDGEISSARFGGEDRARFTDEGRASSVTREEARCFVERQLAIPAHRLLGPRLGRPPCQSDSRPY